MRTYYNVKYYIQKINKNREGVMILSRRKGGYENFLTTIIVYITFFFFKCINIKIMQYDVLLSMLKGN